MKKFKIKIKSILLMKIARLRKENKLYKERITSDILKEQEYVDKITLLENDIRQLLLMLSKENRGLWLNKKGDKDERYFNKKKRIKD